MDQVFGRMVDRTRTRLDVPRLRTLFGAKARPTGTASTARTLDWRSWSSDLRMT